MSGIWLLLIFAPMVFLCGYVLVHIFEDERRDDLVDNPVDKM
jgi:hypothetical protein